MSPGCESKTCPGKSSKTYFCELCDCDLCDDCWPEQLPHDPGRRNSDRHEKIDRRLEQILDPILNATSDPVLRNELLEKDRNSKWFSHFKDPNGQVYFQDYDRYATLMRDRVFEECPPARYPQLVSVIGETGVGKSSIIKMLIDLCEIDSPTDQLPGAPTPVIGSVNSNLPTTSSVHLYEDPKTLPSEKPILFADMEGLRGGEINPTAEDQQHGPEREARVCSPHGLYHEVKQRFRGSRRVHYATTPETQTREYTVTQLYPRILYTFSDAVIFVMRGELRTFETVLGQLIDWASKSMEHSLNQPNRPHAIIVANFTDNQVDKSQWDVRNATKSLLQDFGSVVHQSAKFQARKHEWNSSGWCINSVEDLLLQYYSSISVVRVPYKGRSGRMKDQMGKLRQEIERCCTQSFEIKRRARLMLDTELFQTYLAAGFEHFTTHLDKPFNFLDITMRINPISRDFAGNILQLAFITYKEAPTIKEAPEDIFSLIARPVASCILLDIIRSDRLGEPIEIMRKHWHKLCDQALEKFSSHVWQCSFVSGNEKCRNVQAFHHNTHQNDRGQVIGGGDYQSTFRPDGYRHKWHSDLEKALEKLLEETQLDYSRHFEVHRLALRGFYDRVDARRYKSHLACLCCLHAFPEHSLPCGHILCTKCVQSHGVSEAPGEYIVKSCPLHDSKKWRDSRRIYLKPPSAGVRILSLDGGGVRGIVILEILKALSKHLPDGIEAQHFFDLIVGTSTGGIIALGLGVKMWRIDDAIERFKSLVGKAFTKRWHILGDTVALLSHGALYRTSPLEEALKECFGDSNLFGGSQSEYRASPKVAVTSTAAIRQRPVIFANYNRKTSEQMGSDYSFERPTNPDDEIKLWEAARATAAAPTFFKPFVHKTSGTQYVDGALYYKCPVRIADHERKLIFPESIDQEPDLLLSIGTGEDRSKPFQPPSRVDSSMTGVTIGSPGLINSANKVSTQDEFHHRTGRTGGKTLHRTCKEFLNRTLDSQRAWYNFKTEVQKSSSYSKQRYRRINPRFPPSVFPKMEDASQVHNLQAAVINMMSETSYEKKLQKTAYHLVASSFYFYKQHQGYMVENYNCRGSILCRFSEGGDRIRKLGEWLRKFATHSFTPCFEIRKIDKRTSEMLAPCDRVFIDEEVTGQMISRAHFELREIHIPQNDEQDQTIINIVLEPEQRYPISGFPANLMPKPSTPRLFDDGASQTASTIDTHSITASPLLQVDENSPRTHRRGTFSLPSFLRHTPAEVQPQRRFSASQNSTISEYSATTSGAFLSLSTGSIGSSSSEQARSTSMLLPIDKRGDKPENVTLEVLAEETKEMSRSTLSPLARISKAANDQSEHRYPTRIDTNVRESSAISELPVHKSPTIDNGDEQTESHADVEFRDEQAAEFYLESSFESSDELLSQHGNSKYWEKRLQNKGKQKVLQKSCPASMEADCTKITKRTSQESENIAPLRKAPLRPHLRNGKSMLPISSRLRALKPSGLKVSTKENLSNAEEVSQTTEPGFVHLEPIYPPTPTSPANASVMQHRKGSASKDMHQGLLQNGYQSLSCNTPMKESKQGLERELPDEKFHRPLSNRMPGGPEQGLNTPPMSGDSSGLKTPPQHITQSSTVNCSAAKRSLEKTLHVPSPYQYMKIEALESEENRHGYQAEPAPCSSGQILRHLGAESLGQDRGGTCQPSQEDSSGNSKGNFQMGVNYKAPTNAVKSLVRKPVQSRDRAAHNAEPEKMYWHDGESICDGENGKPLPPTPKIFEGWKMIDRNEAKEVDKAINQLAAPGLQYHGMPATARSHENRLENEAARYIESLPSQTIFRRRSTGTLGSRSLEALDVPLRRKTAVFANPEQEHDIVEYI